MNHGTLHTPVVILNLFFFFFPCASSCSKEDPSHLRFIIYTTVISVYIPLHQNQGTITQIIICLFLLYLLVKLTPCRFSFVGSHRSNSHSCVSSPQHSHQEWKKDQKNTEACYDRSPFPPVRRLLSLLNRKQKQSAENEVECIPCKRLNACQVDTVRVVIYGIFCATALRKKLITRSFVWFATKVNKCLLHGWVRQGFSFF